MMTSHQALGRQRGMATLIMALVLLGIVSGMTLFSLSYGMQNRRSVGEQAAERLALEVAQAGLDQGTQFFRARETDITSAWLAGPDHRWEPCAAADVSVPCGEVAPAVRSNYLRYSGALDMREVFTSASGEPSAQVIGSRIGGHNAHHDVYALLCLVDTLQPDRQCVPGAEATEAGSPYSGQYAITLIAHAQLQSEQTQTTHQAVARQTIANRAGHLLGIVPGSWSDAGHIDMHGTFLAI